MKLKKISPIWCIVTCLGGVGLVSLAMPFLLAASKYK
jgi:hypothetical protein